jgi:hypothetical protein
MHLSGDTEGTGDTSGLHDSSNPIAGGADDLSNALDAQPGDIEFDRVVALRRFEFAGHVFNLSTAHGYFTIDGLYTGNTIFRTNVMTANASGRFAVQAFPYWRWVGVQDGPPRQRATHEAAHGTILMASDPIWQTVYTPAGYNCRCRVVPMSKKQYDDTGAQLGDPSVIAAARDPGFVCGTATLIRG